MAAALRPAQGAGEQPVLLAYCDGTYRIWALPTAAGSDRMLTVQQPDVQIRQYRDREPAGVVPAAAAGTFPRLARPSL
jgi:hypothetical protein